ncbi:hypothetical protein WAF17_19700 [Bernardetia sp. ABR2-2B]|uniref:hypothetical protein n=1 Tax=Bernardetia sp. ABR2-2B TaxID=3127472 RepID=UPI0030CD6364
MKNINRQQLVIEFVSVVFAVVLALFLNAWRESSSLNTNLTRVKESIKKEILRNDSLIHISYTYRKKLLNSFYANEHLILAAKITDLPVDVMDNEALAIFFKTSLIFGQKQFYDKIEIIQEQDARVLILDKSIFDLKVEDDSIKLFGIGNIQLKTPDLSNRSWDLAQATNTIIKMDIELVEKLSILNSLIDTYTKTSENALQMIYTNNQAGLLSVMEDMHHLESKIMQTNTSLLETLKK